MSMSKFLAEFYGTDGSVKEAAAAAEDTEKMASVEIFMKLAKDQNIDLASMKQEEVNALYNGWVTKTSAATTKTAEEEEEEGKEKKKEEAKKEFEEKKAQQEKIAEADFLGRVMAHSFAQESREIAKTASNLAAAKDFAGKAYMGAKNLGQHAHELKHKATEGAKAVGEHLRGHSGHAAGAAGAAGAAAGAAAGHALGKHKEGSAIEDLASYRAVTLAHENGLDAEEAARKIAAVIELGLNKPSEKIASAPDVETAVGIRALELLETAGYPVTWTA